MATMWPEPVSAKKPIPERVPAAPVQVTVHSIFLFPCRLTVLQSPQMGCAYGTRAYSVMPRPMPVMAAHAGIHSPHIFDSFLHLKAQPLLRCNKKAITIANSRAFLHTPLVSSTL
jgi:hypothetical protein